MSGIRNSPYVNVRSQKLIFYAEAMIVSFQQPEVVLTFKPVAHVVGLFPSVSVAPSHPKKPLIKRPIIHGFLLLRMTIPKSYNCRARYSLYTGGIASSRPGVFIQSIPIACSFCWRVCSLARMPFTLRFVVPDTSTGLPT